MSTNTKNLGQHHFKIAVSFSGDMREKWAKPIVEKLQVSGFSKDDVFYDNNFRALIAQTNADVVLDNIFSNGCDLAVALISKEYIEKHWTGVEWRAVSRRINERKDNSVLVVRLDDCSVEKLPRFNTKQDIYYNVDQNDTPESLASDIALRWKALDIFSVDDKSSRMLEALQMLGSEAPTTRIAGAYALSDIADDEKGDSRQRVVDLLCGYLRSDRMNDNAVEAVVLQIISSRVKKALVSEIEIELGSLKKDSSLWCDCKFDLHGASFCEKVCFDDAVFLNKVDLRGSRFNGASTFNGAIFGDSVDFSGAHFQKSIMVSHAKFKLVKFYRAKFCGQVNFYNTLFCHVYFSWAEFYTIAIFACVKFDGETYFDEVRFKKEVLFIDAIFNDRAMFFQTSFKNFSDFSSATFAGDAVFCDSIFYKAPVFSFTKFKNLADFRGIRFRYRTKENFLRLAQMFDGSYYPSLPNGLPESRALLDHHVRDGDIPLGHS